MLNGLKKKNVLLVSHSVNIPAIIKKLVGKGVSPILESEYDNFRSVKLERERLCLLLKNIEVIHVNIGNISR